MARDAEKLAAQAGRLSELKELSRKTAREIAEAVGVTERQVQRWIAGDGDIGPDNLKKLAAFFGTTPDYIEYGVMARPRVDTPDPFAGPSEDAALLAEINQRLMTIEMRIEEFASIIGPITKADVELLRAWVAQLAAGRTAPGSRTPPAVPRRVA